MHDYSERQTIWYLCMHICLYGANTLNMNEPIKTGALVNTKTHKHIQQSFNPAQPNLPYTWAKKTNEQKSSTEPMRDREEKKTLWII